jgi:hypothetical protein
MYDADGPWPKSQLMTQNTGAGVSKRRAPSLTKLPIKKVRRGCFGSRSNMKSWPRELNSGRQRGPKIQTEAPPEVARRTRQTTGRRAGDSCFADTREVSVIERQKRITTSGRKELLRRRALCVLGLWRGPKKDQALFCLAYCSTIEPDTERTARGFRSAARSHDERTRWKTAGRWPAQGSGQQCK